MEGRAAARRDSSLQGNHRAGHRAHHPGPFRVLYCGGGYRSALAADNLQKMGYTNCLSLAGGWRDWVGRGLPVEK